MDKAELVLFYSRIQRVHLLSDTLHMYASHLCDLLGGILSGQAAHVPDEFITQYINDIDGILAELNTVQKSVKKTRKGLQEDGDMVQ